MLIKSKYKTAVVALILVITFLNSCDKNIEPLNKDNLSHSEQLAIDDEIIRNYMESNNIEAVKDSSGLYYLITKEGDGNFPNVNSTVEVNYKGYFTNGSVFEDTENKPVSFILNQLIYGWQIGIPLISKGGEITLFMPSYLGYGSYAIGPIPANSVLIFEIELVDFQ